MRINADVPISTSLQPPRHALKRYKGSVFGVSTSEQQMTSVGHGDCIAIGISASERGNEPMFANLRESTPIIGPPAFAI